MTELDKELFDALRNAVLQLNRAIEEARQYDAFVLIEISKHEHLPHKAAKRLSFALVRQLLPNGP